MSCLWKLYRGGVGCLVGGFDLYVVWVGLPSAAKRREGRAHENESLLKPASAE